MNALPSPAVAALLLGLAWNLPPVSAAPENVTNAPSLAFSDARFSSPAPYSSDAELGRRLGIKTPPLGYDISAERFRVGIPSDSTNRASGLFVWVSPGDDPRVPPAWATELAKRKLFFVSAYASGNERNAIDRCRLALDAACNLCRQHKIDPERIYIAGFSGGGRIASILGVSCADIFAGCMPMCGVDFYRDVPFGRGQSYPATYRANPQLLRRAREHGRFVLLTGEFDENRENTNATVERGFRAERFRHVRYMEVSGMRHTLPSAAVFGTALDSLETRALPAR
jgi:hypothetical protein